MAWMKKKKPQEPEGYEEEEDDEDYDEAKTIKQSITNQKYSAVPIKQDEEEVIAFSIPAREGLAYKNSKQIVGDGILEILADIKNQLNRIEKGVTA